eukprot:CAMPEP_0176371372 /NCGR_PEP_ID=MMETSP0126-20121128/24647_1 /TAXON_ID=141414 ORGANISM="Strombidinopsis acuminatum, Strain SPMC142" /NCGR_SAMPLE_ID=MMETSP0126 /ASSEMBLY_ACC=CAM_ASM_000229 /LENGTH=66 /DNA_ID=CAMNT_0017730793 /DNA_START=21 /DNA_END=221 /DNA_ORIENTATION=-
MVESTTAENINTNVSAANKENENKKTVKILCSDGEVVECDKELASMSILIKGMMDDAENPDEEIPL